MSFETERRFAFLGSVARLALFPGWLWGCVACSGTVEDSSGPASAAPITQEEFAATYARRTCESLTPCCESAGYAQDFDNCLKVTSAEIDARLAEFAGLHVTFDGHAARQCVEGQAAVESRCNLYWRPFNADPAACNHLFVGRQKTGAPCSLSDECVAGLYCSGTERVCTTLEIEPRVHASLGEACGQTCQGDSTSCDPDPLAGPLPATVPACFRDEGLFCNGGTCSPLSGLGGPCRVREDCDGLYRCSSAATCAPFAQEGERCSSNDDCESYRCDVDASVCMPILLTTVDDCAGY
jgi:hypothetical protein